ncbi:GTPase ObgE [Salsipaludibacter albus]|uniref:GTPase ObgE n=1 Tax=Salsipaludibacter albus TaxID=2849650 RepID=UPI001EE44351|nr:GTPase ObgE [Salsipaludibacter albus]
MSDAVEFIDSTPIHVRGGRGGNGAASMRRESHVPRGGPDGGDGGRGGDVVLVAKRGQASLLDIQRNPHRRGDDGGHGSSQRKSGAAGEDAVVTVPIGTVVRTRDGRLLADLTTDGQRFVAAEGGRGGRGNVAFANRHRRVPRFAEYGEEVEERSLQLDLKVIADVGLVGFPSAGKSSLVSRLSAARPRIEAWPFTTLTPHLGMMRAGNRPDGSPIDVVLADVPGLVEGASDGKGLGHRFLRHVERCRVLLHVLDTAPFDPDRDPLVDLAVLRRELVAHDPELAERVEVVVLNKVDLPDGRAMADLVRPRLQDEGWEVFEVSAISGEGLDALRYRLGELVAAARDTDPTATDDGDEPVVITLRESGPDYRIGRDPSGAYAVVGRRIERWVQMLPIDNPDAARYLQGRLRRAGVVSALVDAGARSGDEVVIGEAVFDFQPELDDLPAEERAEILAGEFDDDDPDEVEGDIVVDAVDDAGR